MSMNWRDAVRARLQAARLSFPEWRLRFLGRDTPEFQAPWAPMLRPGCRELILCPTGHGKSQHWSVDMVLWQLCEHPARRILLASKTDEQARKFLGEVARHLESNAAILDHYGDLQDPSGKWTDHMLYVRRPYRHKDPSLEARGVGSAVTGGRYHLCILDDIQDERNSHTRALVDGVEEWLYGTALQRLDEHDPMGGPGDMALAVGTRKHPQDLYGRMIEAPRWRVTLLQAFPAGIPEHRYIYDAQGMISGVEVLDDRPALWPERQSRERLLLMLADAGPYFHREQMQDVRQLGADRILDPSWLGEYQDAPEDLAIYQGVDLCAYDPAATSTDTDYMAILTLGHDRASGSVYLLDLQRERLDFGAQARAISAAIRRWQPIRCGIESNAAQVYMAQYLSDQDLEVQRVVSKIKPRGRKEERWLSHVPLMQQGRVLMPAEPRAQVWREFLAEFAGAPAGAHDDTLDALDIALRCIGGAGMEVIAPGVQAVLGI